MIIRAFDVKYISSTMQNYRMRKSTFHEKKFPVIMQREKLFSIHLPKLFIDFLIKRQARGCKCLIIERLELFKSKKKLHLLLLFLEIYMCIKPLKLITNYLR